jgi:hypothetical protein
MAFLTAGCGDIVCKRNQFSIPHPQLAHLRSSISIILSPLFSQPASLQSRAVFPIRYLPFTSSEKQRSRHHSPSRPWFLIPGAEAWSPRTKQTHRNWLLVERGRLEGSKTSKRDVFAAQHKSSQLAVSYTGLSRWLQFESGSTRCRTLSRYRGFILNKR